MQIQTQQELQVMADYSKMINCLAIQMKTDQQYFGPIIKLTNVFNQRFS